MTDPNIYKEYAATCSKMLEQYIMDPCRPKSEHEWWASREITRLREENEKLREELITSSKKYYDIGYACAKDMANDKVEILSAENKRLERENKKSRVALLRIQCIAQDITRPIPFQEEDDEN